jgi:hypothetical protein
MADGEPCAPYIQEMMNRPGVLRARARIRAQIAEQDRAAGDTLAEWRNFRKAQEYEERARRQEP